MEKIVPNLIPGKTYKLRYRAVDAAGQQGSNSAVYEFTVPGVPAPSEVNQDTISVVTSSTNSGVIIAWNPPLTVADRPSAVKYIVHISDTPDFTNHLALDATINSVYFSNQAHESFFGRMINVIYIRVLSVSSADSFTIPSGYRRYSYIDEEALRPPDIVTAMGSVNSYLVSWTYRESIPSIVDTFSVYRRREGEDWELAISGLSDTTSTYEGVIDPNLKGNYYIGVSAYDGSSNESSIRESNLITVVTTGDVDTDAPSVPTGLIATAGTDKTALVEWNASATGDPFGYRLQVSLDETNWSSYDTPATSYTLYNLNASDTYYLRVAAYDSLFNLSSYTSNYSFVTPIDIEKPSAPAVIQIMVQDTSQSGEQNVVAKHSNKKANNTDFLETDIARFDVYVSDTNTNSGGTYMGTIPATSPTTTNNTGYGSSGTIVYDFDAATVGSKYFYTVVVDTSGNQSDPSVTSQATVITYLDNAFIGDLTADRIRTGTLAADQAIYVGTGIDQITIKSDNTGTPVGKIYSGTGTYNNTNTGFYLDSTGQFSLKDQLTWNPTTAALSLRGSINATGGSFTGNVLLNGGSLYTADSPNARMVFNESGISAFNSSNVQTLSIANNGVFSFASGRIGGLTGAWEVGNLSTGNYIRSTGGTRPITLISGTGTNLSKIFVSSDTDPAWKSVGTPFYIDSDRKFSIGNQLHYDGTTFQIATVKVNSTAMFIGTGNHANADTPFYVAASGTTANFSLGNKFVWNGTSLSVTGSGSFSGAITATSGSFTGTIYAGSGTIGGFTIGATSLGGTNVAINAAGGISGRGNVAAADIFTSDIYAINSGVAINTRNYGGGRILLYAGTNINIESQAGYNINLVAGSNVQAPSVYLNTSATAANVRVNTAGDLLRATSSITIKENIYSLSDRFNYYSEIDNKKLIAPEIKFNYRKILDIVPSSFTEIGQDREIIGFIADDIAAKVPEIAEYDNEGNPEFFTIAGIAACMLAVIKDQQEEIDGLNSRLLQLESRLGET